MTRSLFSTIALTLVTASAQAQTFQVDATGAIHSGLAVKVSNGLYEPTLASDNLGSLIVAFATPVTAQGCSEAWAIGYAASSDGLHWSVSPDYVIAPKPGTPAACGARSPSLVIDENNVARIWFSAVDNQGKESIAAAMINFDNIRIKRASGLNGVLEPSVASMAGGYRMIGVDGSTGDLVSATSDNGVSWSRDAGVALPTGAVSFGLGGYTSPSLTCESGVAFPWTMHYAGVDNGVLTDWGYGVSSDGGFWFLSPGLGFPGGVPTSFDTLETDNGGTVMVYAEPDGLGSSHLSFASTGAWAPMDLNSRICP